MIKSFSQYLAEGREGFLYHGTGMLSARMIIESDTLAAGWSGPHRMGATDKRTISFSRSARYAFWFVTNCLDQVPVVFELDQAKLAHNFKIIPFNYYKHRARRHVDWRETDIDTNASPLYTQQEEFIEGSINKASRYITRIIITEEVYNKLMTLTERPYDDDARRLIGKHPLLYIEGKGFANKHHVDHPLKLKVIKS